MSWTRLAYLRRERIGRGSCGSVYRARLWRNGETVAVKVLATTDNDDHQVARLETEAATLARLAHPGIVRMHGVHRHRGGRLAVVVEYVDGCSLAQLLEYGPLSVPAALHVARSVLDALEHAHQRGIVHRDVSANNVLIARDGQVKLADFGLATLVGNRPTTGHHVSGTLPYVAPEQILGGELDGRADLFAVGVLLHVMLTGQTPYSAASRSALLAQILGAAPTGELLPGAVAEVVARLLSREREERFASADQVLAALPMVPNGQERLHALVSMRLHRPTRPPRAGLWLAMAAAAGLLIGYHANHSPGPDRSAETLPAQHVPSRILNQEESRPSPLVPDVPDDSEATTEAKSRIEEAPRSRTLESRTRAEKRRSKSSRRRKRARSSTGSQGPETKANAPNSNETTGASWEYQPPTGMTLEQSQPRRESEL